MFQYPNNVIYVNKQSVQIRNKNVIRNDNLF